MLLAYPSLTNAEFAQACAALSDLCTGNLEDSSWTTVKWTGDELRIQNRRDDSSAPAHDAEDLQSSDFEDDDLETFDRHNGLTSSNTIINFSIVLSPVYQTPVLWFKLASELPTSTTMLDHVYDIVVLPSSRKGLRDMGVLGGISMANHPVSDVPAFFIHPCRTQEALQTIRPSDDISPLQYLLLWFGVIGSAVGLAIPANVLASARRDSITVENALRK